MIQDLWGLAIQVAGPWVALLVAGIIYFWPTLHAIQTKRLDGGIERFAWLLLTLFFSWLSYPFLLLYIHWRGREPAEQPRSMGR